eukprot:GEZU01012595.1.p2 GENE.GEZU01012595.1~~GEZU01012595.1.p2  ORF type:complete len:146 (+),score=37.14 GEZU01012595.1:105-542(+)
MVELLKFWIAGQGLINAAVAYFLATKGYEGLRTIYPYYELTQANTSLVNVWLMVHVFLAIFSFHAIFNLRNKVVYRSLWWSFALYFALHAAEQFYFRNVPYQEAAKILVWSGVSLLWMTISYSSYLYGDRRSRRGETAAATKKTQ